ncbi:MAG TPA: GspH/FimT family pseudopilin [Gemmatimonadales bacterium]|nr:GspH/FimT family pseudopilin [Gemmatimonadales bacterium]
MNVRSRSGFTLFELLTAIVLMGIVLTFAYPRISRFATSGSLRTARGSMITAVNVAKSAAVASGRCGFLKLTSSSVTVFTVNCQGSGTQKEIVSNRNFQNDYGVTLTMQRGSGTPVSADSLGFDPRGIPINNTQSVTFTISKGGESKTVVVGNYGRVQ